MPLSGPTRLRRETPGCLIGSIGALMEFVNLAQLYDWAKMASRYAITTGKFKDAGADYPASNQRATGRFFGTCWNDVLAQFKAAIKVEGRNMKPEVLDQYADGRVFTWVSGGEAGFRQLGGDLGRRASNARANDWARRQPRSIQS